MQPEEVADLLNPPNRLGSTGALAELGLHQGVILDWNKQTGQNKVSVAGATLDDLPMLNLTEALVLDTGDVVAVLRFRSTYFILGRITVPNTAGFFTGAMPDLPAPFYPRSSDAALQSNVIGNWYPKMVAGWIVNHPVAAFGARVTVSGGTAVGSFRVQWYTAQPGDVNPANGTLMAQQTGIASPGLANVDFSYTWPAGMRGQLVFLSYEVNLTAGVGGTDWISALPVYFVGRDDEIINT